MSDLEEALSLRPTSDGGWAVFTDSRYDALNGMFGGWTAAILLRAAMEDRRRDGSPAALNVNFIAKVEAGEDVDVRARYVGGGRSLQHWQATMSAADGRMLAQAAMVFAKRRVSDGFSEVAMPEAPEPQMLEEGERHPPGAFGGTHISPTGIRVSPVRLGRLAVVGLGSGTVRKAARSSSLRFCATTMRRGSFS
jgi:acyl-CoA thioesterase